MSLSDAIIASTALNHQQALVTRNTKDFQWIDNLILVNPFDDMVDQPEAIIVEV